MLSLMMIFEWVAVVAGVACVWLLLRQNIWTFPIGLLFSVITLVILVQQRLYANSIETAYYLVMNAYGWWLWSRSDPALANDNSTALKVTLMPSHWWPPMAALALVVTLGFGWLLARFTDADLAYLDSATTTGAFIAMWMSARKYLQSWVLWFVVDVAYIGLYAYKGLPGYALLYLIYLGLAVAGWRAWQQDRLARA